MLADTYAWYLENLDSRKSRQSLKSIGKKVFSSVVDSPRVVVHSDSYFDDLLLDIEQSGGLFRYIYGSGNETFKSDLALEMLSWGADVGLLISPWSTPKIRAGAFARVVHTIDEKS